jgi:ankyrin repeat protein
MFGGLFGPDLPTTPLFKAAGKGDLEKVKLQLGTSAGKSHINQLCQNGWAPLHMASMNVRCRKTAQIGKLILLLFNLSF